MRNGPVRRCACWHCKTCETRLEAGNGTLADVDLDLELAASHQPCLSLCLRSLRCLFPRCCCTTRSDCILSALSRNCSEAVLSAAASSRTCSAKNACRQAVCRPAHWFAAGYAQVLSLPGLYNACGALTASAPPPAAAASWPSKAPPAASASDHRLPCGGHRAACSPISALRPKLARGALQFQPHSPDQLCSRPQFSHFCIDPAP